MLGRIHYLYSGIHQARLNLYDVIHKSNAFIFFFLKQVASIHNYNPIKSPINTNSKSFSAQKQTRDGLESSRLSIDDRQQLSTTGKETEKERRSRKRCVSCTPWRFFTLALVLSLFLIAIAVVTSVLIASKAKTTTTISMIRFFCSH
jgi:predicted adenine nucleotide alpha hydrolase (AANH) superfamily ATPase